MAKVLRFPKEARASSAPVEMAGTSAEILFFTGVRYVRSAPEQSKPARRQRRRAPSPTRSA